MMCVIYTVFIPKIGYFILPYLSCQTNQAVAGPCGEGYVLAISYPPIFLTSFMSALVN